MERGDGETTVYEYKSTLDFVEMGCVLEQVREEGEVVEARR